MKEEGEKMTFTVLHLEFYPKIMATQPDLNEIEVNVDNETSEDNDDTEENLVEHRVPYIHNEYVLKYVNENGNAAASRMLVELPLCHTNDENIMASCLSKLKKKRAKLLKRTSAEGKAKLDSFLSEEFAFPEPSGIPRYENK